ncbi:hypothetical protein [Natrinema soli]|uniref:CHAT domain-containing protein n=1 Tax=Natrinema soli TaxID=1930624 RepID=A0ABD5SPC8_9EURY|nr:hypothetical protein [Natrinema soli]
MKPKFEPTEEGIEIIDPIERHRYRLTMNEPVSLESAAADQIGFPVGSVVQFTADSIVLPTTEGVFVRDSEGMMLAKVSPADQAEFPSDKYTLDLSGPLKVYACVDSSVRIFSDSDQTYVNFAEKTAVILGARSFHEQPAGTITTTSNPSDLMGAVSAFGSALKTTTPERAYPTLRGHPPRLELGDEFHIPDRFDQLEHNIQIEIPATLPYVFVVAPLAYYLGARVVSGQSPQIATERGYTYELKGLDDFELSVKQVLKQLFFLDCIVRTEGTTPLPLHERQAIEPLLDFDFKTTYNEPLAKRIETYLEIPYKTLKPHLPDWGFEIQLEPTEEHIQFLPFLANDLAVVNIQDITSEPTPSEPIAEQAIKDFTRDDFVRSAQPYSVRGDTTVAESSGPTKPSTIQQSWAGINDSEIVSTTPLSAYQNSIGRTPKDGPIEIDVICNDKDMREELESVNGTYGTREKLPFNTTVHYDLSTDILEDVLARDSDFLHYIGHIDEGGFQCTDGKLDAATVDSVGAKAFLLNACQSHDQGLHLVETGSTGGIVTLGNVVNSGAVSVGGMIARLLNLGFPLYAALDIARQENIIGQQYLMVGDGRTTIAQSETRAPNVCSVIEDSNGTLVEMDTYTSAEVIRGGVFSPHIDSVESFYVIPRKTDRIPVSTSELRKFFDKALFPVIRDNQVKWSKDLLGE